MIDRFKHRPGVGEGAVFDVASFLAGSNYVLFSGRFVLFVGFPMRCVACT